MRRASALLGDVAIGAGLGLLFLGIGGRVAMRAVAISLGQPPVLGSGTLTVIASGAAAGAAGALLYAVGRWAGARLAPSHPTSARALRVALFGALLALVTARGLSGSPGPTWLFWLLVAAYGAALELVQTRRGAGTSIPRRRAEDRRADEDADAWRSAR